ncbi:hypothetical protein U1Q18_044924 [Sarracenia purpurea var. burkii]
MGSSKIGDFKGYVLERIRSGKEKEVEVVFERRVVSFDSWSPEEIVDINGEEKDEDQNQREIGGERDGGAKAKEREMKNERKDKGEVTYN